MDISSNKNYSKKQKDNHRQWLKLYNKLSKIKAFNSKFHQAKNNKKMSKIIKGGMKLG